MLGMDLDILWFVVLPLLPFNSMPFPFYNPVSLHGLSIFAPMKRRQWSQSDAWRATGNRLCSFTFYGKKVTPLREGKVARKVWNNWQAHAAHRFQSNCRICLVTWGVLQYFQHGISGWEFSWSISVQHQRASTQQAQGQNVSDMVTNIHIQ